MTPFLLCTRSRRTRPGTFLAGLMAVLALGIGASASLLAQQPAAGPAPRRAATPAKASPGGQRPAASTAAGTRGGKGTASNAASSRSRAPAGSRAAVQQTSATVGADGGVVLAGGAAALADCRQCGRQECAKCRPAGGRLGLPCNGLCEQGGCPAHCPVRPDQFGYYATRWRSWPGQGVKQVGHFDPATTPAVPPRSEVPSMEDELALPSQRDEAPAEEEGDEEEEAMADGESDAADKNDAPADDTEPVAAKPAEGANDPADAKGDLPAGKPSAPSAEDAENEKVKSGEKAAAPAKASGLLDTSGADASRAGGSVTGGAWSNWARDSATERQPTPPGSVVRTSGPAESVEVVSPSEDRRASPKLRSPAQRMVEGSERAVGRWRAKATASEESASGDTAANPLRGVTAQPGNPLR